MCGDDDGSEGEELLGPEVEDPAESFFLGRSGSILLAGAVGASIIAIISLLALPDSAWGSGRIDDAPADAGTSDKVAVQVAQQNAADSVRDVGLRLALGWGAVAAGLVAYGRLQLSRAENQIARETSARQDRTSARQDREQTNQHWTTAVGQLGSERQEIRLGGVHSLEQFYRDVPPARALNTEVSEVVADGETRWPDGFEPPSPEGSEV